MPELPEVECVRRSLERGLIGRVVRGVEIRRRDVITAPGDPPGGFSRSRSLASGRGAAPVAVSPADLLVGSSIERVDRRGKQLAIRGFDPRQAHRGAIIVQLGMTGQLLLADDSSIPEEDHAHVVWTIDGPPGTQSELCTLVFRDPRRFGVVRIIPSDSAVDEAWSELGPDALAIAGADLRAALRSSRRPIKAALLDQTVLAGVGNIYADEALWRSGVGPKRLACGLKAVELERLAASVRGVLREAIDSGGSTIRDYVDGSGRAGSFQLRHAVYGRAGEPCLRCGRTLSSAVIAQRTTVWCRACQRAGVSRSVSARSER